MLSLMQNYINMFLVEERLGGGFGTVVLCRTEIIEISVEDLLIQKFLKKQQLESDASSVAQVNGQSFA